MRLLKENKPLQYAVVLLPLILCLTYIMFYLYDLQNVYYMAVKNLDIMKEYGGTKEIVSYEILEDSKVSLVDTDGNTFEVVSPDYGLVLSNSDISYYSEVDNIILQPTGKDYASNFIVGSNGITVIGCIGVLIVLLIFTVICKTFSILSRYRFLICYIVMLFVVGGMFGCTYLIFS